MEDTDKTAPTLEEILNSLISHSKLTDENFKVVREALMEFRDHIVRLNVRVANLEAPK